MIDSKIPSLCCCSLLASIVFLRFSGSSFSTLSHVSSINGIKSFSSISRRSPRSLTVGVFFITLPLQCCPLIDCQEPSKRTGFGELPYPGKALCSAFSSCLHVRYLFFRQQIGSFKPRSMG